MEIVKKSFDPCTGPSLQSFLSFLAQWTILTPTRMGQDQMG